jgi:hypothetical protein
MRLSVLPSPFVSVPAVRILAQYHRPGFHPNDLDTKRLIAGWRQALFGRSRITDRSSRWASSNSAKSRQR